MPSILQDTALVTAMGGLCVSSILYASVLMNSLRILASVYWGYPKSIISSRSSYCKAKLYQMSLPVSRTTNPEDTESRVQKVLKFHGTHNDNKIVTQ